VVRRQMTSLREQKTCRSKSQTSLVAKLTSKNLTAGRRRETRKKRHSLILQRETKKKSFKREEAVKDTEVVILTTVSAVRESSSLICLYALTVEKTL
jgi:hypothetical protein